VDQAMWIKLNAINEKSYIIDINTRKDPNG